MPQVRLNLEEKVLQRLEHEAGLRGKSRKQFLEELLAMLARQFELLSRP